MNKYNYFIFKYYYIPLPINLNITHQLIKDVNIINKTDFF